MTRLTIRQRCEPLLRRAFHLYFRFKRGMTLGVRAIVLNERGEVLLIKHTYVAGWHFPGGGVEVGQTFREALARELMEEVAVTLTAEPAVHGVFLNDHVSKRDHVMVYVVRAFTQGPLSVPNREIAECGFFPVDELPDGTTVGTRMRLREVLDGQGVIPTWRLP